MCPRSGSAAVGVRPCGGCGTGRRPCSRRCRPGTAGCTRLVIGRAQSYASNSFSAGPQTRKRGRSARSGCPSGASHGAQSTGSLPSEPGWARSAVSPSIATAVLFLVLVAAGGHALRNKQAPTRMCPSALRCRGCWRPRRHRGVAGRSRPTGRASWNPACPGPRRLGPARSALPQPVRYGEDGGEDLFPGTVDGPSDQPLVSGLERAELFGTYEPPRTTRALPAVQLTPGGEHQAEHAVAQLKSWRLLRRVRSSTRRIGTIVKAIHTLMTCNYSE